MKLNIQDFFYIHSVVEIIVEINQKKSFRFLYRKKRHFALFCFYNLLKNQKVFLTSSILLFNDY